MAWALLSRWNILAEHPAVTRSANDENAIRAGRHEGGIMTLRLPQKITLGDLIAAVTDEVSPVARGAPNANILVSYIVRDLFASRRVRLKKRGTLKIA